MQALETSLAFTTFVLILVGGFFARALMTTRAWWLFISVVALIFVGITLRISSLTLMGLTVLFWFAAERLRFALLVQRALRRLRVLRAIHDARGPVNQLWTDQTFQVHVRVELPEDDVIGAWLGGLPHVSIRDRPAFQVERVGVIEAEDLLSGPRADGPLRAGLPLELEYTVHCPTVGQARFEGVRLLLADLQGFFFHAAFVRAPLVLRVLPRLVEYDWQAHIAKRNNALPPPGIHRLRQAGSSSELLDLRDYMPGDPPKTIAWKVSARRDRLITKDFEKEAPIRCTLFVDSSLSVRLGGREGTPLQRLIEIAVGVLRANTAARDLTGMVLFDEQEFRLVRPERNRNHVARVLHMLTDAAIRAPIARAQDPDQLLPLAYAFAEEVYPDLLTREVNAMPWWVHWIASFPGNWRRRVGLIRFLHRRKLDMLWNSTVLMPLGLLLSSLIAGLFLDADDRKVYLVLSLLVAGLFLVGSWAIVGFTLLVSERERRQAGWRKRLAAFLSVRHGLAPGGLEALLEDDDLLSLHIQRFLADHHVPYAVPLYDDWGRYLFAALGKIAVLSRALIEAVGRGRDNELFVLLADLAELDEHLEPLLRAVRVALGRHHQVVLVFPWPAGMALPSKERPADAAPATPGWQARSGVQSYQAAYHRVKRRFAALGVPVVCAAADEAVSLILQRVDRLRGVARRR